jgi:hypothetical protein
MTKFLFAAIVVERITEIITSSDIAAMVFKDRLRVLLYGIQKETWFRSFLVFIDKLTSCGYCCSVWVSAGVSIIPEARFFDNYIMNTMLLHGLSNLYHVLYELVKRGRVHSYDINLKQEEPYDASSQSQ